MKLSIILSIIYFGIIGQISAQKFSREFGKLEKEEIEMKQYKPDLSAEAVVLFDIGKSEFVRDDNGFEVVFEKRCRVKILSEAGIKWAQVEIPFYREGEIFETITDLEAKTYNFTNGNCKISSLNLSDCHDVKLDESWKARKFALPDIKVGSIFEYKYRIHSQYMFNLRDWRFQSEIPTIYSEYIVRMIPFYEYIWLLQGATKFDETETYEDTYSTQQYGSTTFNDLVHRYVMKNIPAFKDESYISSIENYIIKINFQLDQVKLLSGAKIKVITTWPELISELLKHQDFGKYTRKSENSASDVLDIKYMLTLPPRTRLDSVINYVKQNYNWDEDNGIYSDKSVSNFIRQKTGNCADINLFTIGLLNACGIEANPVLISTRKHGTIKYNYPYTHFFNYVVILSDIDGSQILSDATEPNIPNNRIPVRCINDKGLIMKKGEPSWVDLDSKNISSEKTIISIKLSDTAWEAKLNIQSREYFALERRNNMVSDDQEYCKELSKVNYKPIKSSLVIKNKFDKESPLLIEYKVNGQPENINGKIYISPFLEETSEVNPLTQPKRTFPIDLIYRKQNSYISSIQIMDGYQAEFIPENYSISNDLFELNYTVLHNENQLNFNFSYAFKRAIYAASDYYEVKAFINDIIKKGNEKVVLIKK